MLKIVQLMKCFLYTLHCTGSVSGVDRAIAHKRHNFAEPPAAPSPSHSRSDSSEGYSSRRSSRDSGRMVVSPTHHPGSQRVSSWSSAERSSASPVHVSAYEQMLNGATGYIRTGQSAQPVVNGSMTIRDQESPSGVSRRIVSNIGQQTAPSGHDRPVSSPNPGSPSKYNRKKHHQYDHVRVPHGYEEIDLPIRERSQLSQASTKSESKLNSKWSRFSHKNESEKGTKSEPNKRVNMHMSDSRLHKITRRKGSDKTFGARKSPGASKRFSTGAFMMEGGEARRRKENSDAFVKAKYRVSNPEPNLDFYSEMTQEELAQEDASSGENERVRKNPHVYLTIHIYNVLNDLWLHGTVKNENRKIFL